MMMMVVAGRNVWVGGGQAGRGPGVGHAFDSITENLPDACFTKFKSQASLISQIEAKLSFFKASCLAPP